MTQKQRILSILKRRKRGIRNAELIFKTGITNPHKRIAELEKDGHAISRIDEWHQPKQGRGAWVVRYVYAGEWK